MATSNDLVTVDDLVRRSGLSFSTDPEKAFAEELLDGLVNMLEEQRTGWLWQRSVTEDHYDFVGENLYLRRLPVVSVSDLSTIAWDDTTDTVSADTYRVTNWGIKWPPTEADLRVTYTAGLDKPAAAKTVVLSAATRIAKRRDEGEEGIEQISQEGYSVQLVTDVFTESELSMLPRQLQVRG